MSLFRACHGYVRYDQQSSPFDVTPDNNFDDGGCVYVPALQVHRLARRNNLEDLVVRIASAELVKLWPLS